MSIDTVREAIDEIQEIKWLVDEGPAHVKLTEAQTRLTDLIAALSAIDPEKIRRECAEKAEYWYTQVLCVPEGKLSKGLYRYVLAAEPAQDDGKPGAVMTMIENGDLTISWECSGCKNTIDDRDDMETVKYCPYCGETIREFLYIEEAKE